MKERISKHTVATTEGTQIPELPMTPNHEYTIAGQFHAPEDKGKTDPIVLLIREPDRLVEHDRYVRKSEL